MIINWAVVNKDIWKSKPGRYSPPQGPFRRLEIRPWEFLIISRALLQDKEIMIKMRVCRDEVGACCTAGIIAGDLTGESGLKISVISFQLGLSLRAAFDVPVIASMCGQTLQIALCRFPSIRYRGFKNMFLDRDRKRDSASCIPQLWACHVDMLDNNATMWTLFIKTLPYVVCACFPFKIYEWKSCSCSQVHGPGSFGTLGNRLELFSGTVLLSCSVCVCVCFVVLPKYFPQLHTSDTSLLPLLLLL